MTEVAADAPAGRPTFRVIDADASPEEVAAIVAAVTAALGSAGAAGAVADAEPVSRWRRAARVRSRGVGSWRGEWRLSDRMGPRVRP